MTEEHLEYGCLFCMSGTERILRDLIAAKLPAVSATPAMYERYRTYRGKKRSEQAVFMPGYVFFAADSGVNLDLIHSFPQERGFRALGTDEGDWRLRNRDREFARWLFSYGGLLRFSKAYEEDNWVHFLEGPLLDLEKQVIRVDRRGRAAQIKVSFQGREFVTWLGFEIVEKPENLI
ncbi:MAG: hypothetical protein IJ083_14485 [Clostridia bacterium]|nr:hypothetical protein [Clostridia bacterium]